MLENKTRFFLYDSKELGCLNYWHLAISYVYHRLLYIVSTIIHEIILNEKKNDCYLTAKCRGTGTDKCCSTVSELMGGNLFLLLWIDGEDSLSSPVYLKFKYKEKKKQF